MKLYERLGFLRSKCLHRYYLNGNTAFRYLLYVRDSAVMSPAALDTVEGQTVENKYTHN